MSYCLLVGQYYEDIFSVEISSSLVTPACVKLTKTNKQTNTNQNIYSCFVWAVFFFFRDFFFSFAIGLVVFWVLSDSSEWILVVVSGEVLFHSPAWPGISSVDQVGCKLTEIPLPLPPGNWVCTTMPGLWCVHGVMSSDLFLCGGEISCQLLNNLIVCVGTFSRGSIP